MTHSVREMQQLPHVRSRWLTFLPLRFKCCFFLFKFLLPVFNGANCAEISHSYWEVVKPQHMDTITDQYALTGPVFVPELAQFPMFFSAVNQR